MKTPTLLNSTRHEVTAVALQYLIEHGNDPDNPDFFRLLRSIQNLTGRRPVLMDGRIDGRVEELLSLMDAKVQCLAGNLDLGTSERDPDYHAVKAEWIATQDDLIRAKAQELIP